LITPSDAPERLAVIERQTAWPRAFYVDKVETYHGRNEFVSRLRADSQLFAAIDGADAIAVAAVAGRTGTATRSVRARDYQLTANTTSFTIDAPEPGIVVLNETFWPGVSATVGDRAADVFRINETMRAVVVPQGTWRMKFSYRPATWNLALGLAASGVAALVVLLWLGRATAAR
jgi:hypothetical protein